ncbi:MAG: glycoside hydrolase family 88 protein, partial [Bacteroidota bacterium]
MKRFMQASLLLISAVAFAQSKTSPEEIVRRVADNIIRTTSFQFVNNKTNEKFGSTKGKDTSVYVKAESKFNKWMYVNGVLAVGMLRISNILKDQKYADYSKKNFSFIFDNLDYFKRQFDAGRQNIEYRPVFRIGSLDDCGSMSAALLDVYYFDKRPDYMEYLNRVSDHILSRQVRFPDGTL